MKEIWKPIIGFEEFYDVSTKGRVRSYYINCSNRVDRVKIPKLLAISIMDNGYVRVRLHRDGVCHDRLVHRIMLETFVGDCPLDMECRHINGIRTSNTIDNLVWGTRQDNQADKLIHGTDDRGSKSVNAKLKEEDVVNICKMRVDGAYYKTIANKYNVSRKTISRIVKRTRWKHVKI